MPMWDIAVKPGRPAVQTSLGNGQATDGGQVGDWQRDQTSQPQSHVKGVFVRSEGVRVFKDLSLADR